MAAGTITSFKIEPSYVEITTDGKYGSTTHKYWSVPREIIKWFINCSKAPTLGDFDDKMQAHRNKHKDTSVCCDTGCLFWGD